MALRYLSQLNDRGVTLVESMIVMVMIGAMTAFAVPALLSARHGFAARHAADEFVTAHRLARATAVRYGRVVRLHIDGSAGRIWMEMDTSEVRNGSTVRVGRMHRIDGGVTMTTTRDLLCFDGRGITTPIWSCPPGNATLLFQKEEAADTVETTVTGKVLR